MRPLLELFETDLFEMSAHERDLLYNHWLSEIREELREQLQKSIDQYVETERELLKCNQEIRLRCLKQGHLIGVTTSGLAKNIDLLRRLKPKVLVCEEAGEILEAHTLTAFLPTIEHAILIVDHEQLRPQVPNYDLSLENPRGEKYSLDLSTFERLITTPEVNVPYDTLQIQRRMDPLISELIRKTIYPKLRNHESVLAYPPVAGFRHRLYWLDHREQEVAADPLQILQTSQSNDYEIGLVRAFATHLVRQGTCEGGDIVVLTPYVRQLQKLRDTLTEAFDIVVEEKDEDELERLDEASDGPQLVTDPRQTHRAVLTERLRLATVDNFQGEEAAIVIVSLVRSNEENRCGFLRTTNRINVLLSRAKHGMYIIGNSETYKHVPMWTKVIKLLRESGRMGFTLPLCCPRHPDTAFEVATPDDFLRKAPEGGCSEQCEQPLQCGHTCTFKCHSTERHDSVVCQAPCERRHKECGHTCTRYCGLECGLCAALIEIDLHCGHTGNKVKCFESESIPASFQFQVKIEQYVPGCGHTTMVRCSKTTLDPRFVCNADCGAALPCGRQCPRPCGECRAVRVNELDHGVCNKTCRRCCPRFAHKCEVICHGDQPCPPCSSPCESRCSHLVCPQQCGESCTTCAEPCYAGCVHEGFCRMLCSAPCDVLPCSYRCENLLACGHRCPAACGEPCPGWGYCQLCANPIIKKTIVNHTQALTYDEIELENNPIIVPSCGHILDIVSMDASMYKSASHIISSHLFPSNSPIRLSSLSIRRMGRCPTCRTPLYNVYRYKRVFNRATLDANTRNISIWADEKFMPLALAVGTEERALDTGHKVPHTSEAKSSAKIRMETSAKKHKAVNFAKSGQWRAEYTFPYWATRVRIGGPRGVQKHNISLLSGLDSVLGPLLKLQEAIMRHVIGGNRSGRSL